MGKKTYEVLFTGRGGASIATQFIHECKTLSMLRHPHIVQFLGVFFQVDSQLPIIVVEKMQYNLHDVLEKTVNIGFAAKNCHSS